MTIKELDAAAVRTWLRIDADDTNEIPMLMSSALDFMERYTGRSETFIQSQPALVYPYLALIGEMYENRQYQMEKGGILNQTLMNVLECYRVNHLVGESDLVGDTDA